MTDKKISLNQFIEGANEEEVKQARKRVSSEKILLSATGRRIHKEKCVKALYYIPQDIENDMTEYCAGSRQAIMTYLLRRGLDELIKENKVIVYEI